MGEAGFRVAYITCRGHSGSTLLDLLISGHGRAVSVGEAKCFSAGNDLSTRCTCGSSSIRECPFWLRVDAAMRRDSDLGLAELDLGNEDPATFVSHNVALFSAVVAVTGKSIVVDSSKNVDRLERLIACESLDVIPIRLVRSPQGVVFSNVRKGRNWLDETTMYVRHHRMAARALHRTDHAVVRYERLAEDPAGQLADLMPRLGLEFEPQQLDWHGRERHNFGGNRMRRSGANTIERDLAWKQGLTLRQRAAIGLLTCGETSRPRRSGLALWQKTLIRLLR